MSSAAFRQAWVITEPALKVVLAIATRDEFFGEDRKRALEARNGEPLSNSRTVQVRDGVAVIPVIGPLVRHADMFSEISGATSYGTLRKDMQKALDDPKVQAILLNVDSPGGEVTGCCELSDAIHAARGQKPIKAYVDGACCSGAYWLASACDEIVMSKTADAGSIGVVWAFLDDSKAMESTGVQEIKFISSQSPLKHADPASDTGAAEYQRIVDDLAQVFVESVARNRGASAVDVLERFGRGGVMVGDRAVSAGLADRVGDFESLLAEMVAEHKTKGRTMGLSKIAAMGGLPAEAAEDEILRSATDAYGFRAEVLSAVGAASAEEAKGKIMAGAEALREVSTLREKLAGVEAESIARDLRATLEQGIADKRLSLGAIQSTLPLFVSDETRRGSLVEAFSKLESVTKDGVVAAMCSVPVTASELKTIQAYAKSSPRSAAEPVDEPARDDTGDAEELDEVGMKIKAAAERTRKVLDRNKKK